MGAMHVPKEKPEKPRCSLHEREKSRKSSREAAKQMHECPLRSLCSTDCTSAFVTLSSVKYTRAIATFYRIRLQTRSSKRTIILSVPELHKLVTERLQKEEVCVNCHYDITFCRRRLSSTGCRRQSWKAGLWPAVLRRPAFVWLLPAVLPFVVHARPTPP